MVVMVTFTHSHQSKKIKIFFPYIFLEKKGWVSPFFFGFAPLIVSGPVKSALPQLPQGDFISGVTAPDKRRTGRVIVIFAALFHGCPSSTSWMVDPVSTMIHYSVREVSITSSLTAGTLVGANEWVRVRVRVPLIAVFATSPGTWLPSGFPHRTPRAPHHLVPETYPCAHRGAESLCLRSCC